MDKAPWNSRILPTNTAFLSRSLLEKDVGDEDGKRKIAPKS